MPLGIAEALKRVSWGRHRVLYAVLFGSALRGAFRDVDVAVLFESYPSLDEVSSLMDEVASVVQVASGMVDLVVLNRDDVPCVLIREVYTKGIPVYYRRFEDYLEDSLRRLKLCWDFEISYKKLNLLEASLSAVKRSWES